MRVLQNRHFFVFLWVALLSAGTAESLASITLTMTGGYIGATQSFNNPITIFGQASSGQAFVLTAQSGSGVNPFAFNPYNAGSEIHSQFIAGGSDLLNFSLSLDGVDVPVNGIGGLLGRPGSEIDIEGPVSVLPSVLVSQVINMPVSFNLVFNLYDLSNTIFGSEPDYIVAGTGFGNVELSVQASPSGEPLPFATVSSAVYTLGPSTSAIPEPISLVVWGFLVLGIVVAIYLRK